MSKFLECCVVLKSLLCATALIAAEGVEAANLTPGELEVRRHLPDEAFDVTTLRLWPDTAPDESRTISDESLGEGTRTRRITNVTQPSITIARPKGMVEPTPAIIVCPGGGYGALGITDGGVDIINWLRPLGVTGVYLKYRVPKRGRDFAQHHHALQDIQRAMSLLRGRAKELGLDPKRIGVIGFSAGGNLAAMLSTNHSPEHRRYDPIDDFDQISCRPDFVALIGPAYITVPMSSAEFNPDLHADEITNRSVPPTFIASALSDRCTVGALHYLLLLRQKHVYAEAHIYEKGGHAEGIRPGPHNQWPPMFADWLRRKGVIASTEPEPAR